MTILDVAPESAAAEQGIKAGDTILEVAGADVQTPDDVKSAVESAAKKGKVLLLVKSGDGQRFVALPVNQG